MKKTSIWKVLLITLAVIVIGGIAGIIIYNSSDMVKLKKQLDLGQKYLAEMNYEESVIAFNRAIEIDPRSADAYLGLANAYLGLGDEEAALETLEAGYEVTGDERLQERVDEMRAAAIEREREAAEAAIEREREAVEENERVAERVEEIWDFIHTETPIGFQDPYAENHLLTYDQIEAFCRPLTEELETYLEQTRIVEQSNRGSITEDWEMYIEHGTGDWEVDAWCILADLYCHMSEMDKCLETRRRGYEATGYEPLNPERPYEWSEFNITDEYGRSIGQMVYGEDDRPIAWDIDAGDGFSSHFEFEYDSGRISKVHNSRVDPYLGKRSSEVSYEYQSNNSVIVTVVDSENYTDQYTLSYNEYGKVVDRRIGQE